MVLFQGGCLRRAYGGEGGMGTKPGLRGGALSAPPRLWGGGAERPGTVGAAAVDQEDLQAGPGLPAQALQTGTQIDLGVVDGNDDADKGLIQKGHLTLCRPFREAEERRFKVAIPRLGRMPTGFR